jgi:hypothetical protein
VNAKTEAIAVEKQVYRVGLWALWALLAIVAATGCAATIQPIEESSLNQGDVGLSQDAPPTGTAEVIFVDLNAVQPAPGDRTADQSCQALHGPLRQVFESKDPTQEAQALGLNVREDQVQITLVLSRQGSAFLRALGVDVGKQTDKQIQAYVPISRLCELAEDKRIEAIYPVSQAETQ